MAIEWSSQSNWYPPSKYVLMPLYRKLRRSTGSKSKAFTLLMAISGFLHVSLYALGTLLFGGNAKLSIGFIVVVFTFLTILAYQQGKKDHWK